MIKAILTCVQPPRIAIRKSRCRLHAGTCWFTDKRMAVSDGGIDLQMQTCSNNLQAILGLASILEAYVGVGERSTLYRTTGARHFASFCSTMSINQHKGPACRMSSPVDLYARQMLVLEQRPELQPCGLVAKPPVSCFTLTVSVGPQASKDSLGERPSEHVSVACRRSLPRRSRIVASRETLSFFCDSSKK